MKVLITGTSQGIGKAIAELFLHKGHCVVGIDRQEASLAHECYSHIQADVRDELPEIEGVEVLVNNAGIRRDNLLMRMSEDDWDAVIGTHLGGFYNVTRLVIRQMLSKRKGRIINMASLSGLKGVPGQANYAAAKGGLIAATRSLANEVGRKGITVNAVAPGFIRTDMTEDLNQAELTKMIPLNRFGEAEEVADLVAFLASDKAAYITGECISINGGLYM